MKATEIFANRLKIARKNMGLTQEELADKLEVSRGAVGHWEVAHREPSMEMLLKMSSTLDVSVEFLLGQTDLKNRASVADYIVNKLVDADLVKENDIDLDTIDRYLDYLKLMKQMHDEHICKK